MMRIYDPKADKSGVESAGGNGGAAAGGKRRWEPEKLRKLAVVALVVASVAGYLLYDHFVAKAGSSTGIEVQKVAPTQAGAEVESGAGGKDGVGGVMAGGPAGPVIVHVTGAVKQPGVYRLEGGGRIGDAVAAAGGLAKGAAAEYVNLAAALEDGLQYHIPTRKETADWERGSGVGAVGGGAGSSGGGAANGVASGKSEAGGRSGAGGASGSGGAPQYKSGGEAGGGVQGGLVNIIRASQSELEGLAGVGPATAKKIIAYRQEHGAFKSKEELKQVKGIGDKKYAALAAHICV